VNCLDRTGKGVPLRIVIAEDYYPLAMTMTWALEANGHEVRFCFDGQDAIGLVESFKPDVVILDINMPRLDGMSACKKIRASQERGNILMVACSVWSNVAKRPEFTAAGFDAYYLKPFDLDRFDEFIQFWYRKSLQGRIYSQ
jgi:two-component system response regulator MprA